MTRKNDILLLLPCHSLDDFPTQAVGVDADCLLTYWTAPWHPALISKMGQAPEWRSVFQLDIESIPSDGRTVILCPTVTHDLLPPELTTPNANPTIQLIDESCGRDELVRKLSSIHEVAFDQVDPDIAADFYSLAYAYLQIELQTRHMHYSSQIDMAKFHGDLVQAAKHAVQGDDVAAVEGLQQCFELLAMERDHFYPVGAHVLDLALVAESTRVDSVEEFLFHPGSCPTDECPTNLWFTGRTLGRLTEAAPELIQKIKTSTRSPSDSFPDVEVLGGEWGTSTPNLYRRESLLRDFRRGLEQFETSLGMRPRTFFRRRFGLTAMLPDLLHQMGYAGAIHATLDAGRFPECSQSRTTWQVGDGHAVEAVGCVPLDASLPETFLQWASRMGQSMEIDYVATICLAHWVGTASPWLEDLRRTAKYGSVLGQFTTTQKYFEETSSNAPVDSFELDGYQSPYLRQAVANQDSNPISRPKRRWQMQAILQQAATLVAWTGAIGGEVVIGQNGDNTGESSTELWRLHDEINKTRDRLSETANSSNSPNSSNAWPDDRQIEVILSRAAESLAAQLRGGPVGNGRLILNTSSHNLRTGCRWDLSETCGGVAEDRAAHAHVYAAGDDGRGSWAAAVDVPALGFAWLDEPAIQTEGKRRSDQAQVPAIDGEKLIHDSVLQNEFLKAEIDETTGSLRSLTDFRTRGNRLAQRLVRQSQLPHIDGKSQESLMRCDAIEVVANSSIYGELRSEGQILVGRDEEWSVVADFFQTFSLWRGSRTLQLSIGIRPVDLPSGNPWQEYFACRWALPRKDHKLYRSMHGIRHETAARRCESPEFFDIEESKRRTTILTAGLPYHHLIDDRFLDSLLIVAGEQSTEFELALGVDLPQPHVVSENWFLPPVAVTARAAPPHSTGWLFHINARHVIATGWELVVPPGDNKTGEPSDVGQVDCGGLRVRLLETSGASGDVSFRMVRPVRTAHRTDFLGGLITELETAEGEVQFRIGPHEWVEIECRW